MKQHFSDFWVLYMGLAMVLFVIFAEIYVARVSNGKIIKANNCEFIEFYKGNGQFQHIHSPKCSNCAGN